MAINKQNAADFLPFVEALADGEDVSVYSETKGRFYIPKGGFTFDQDVADYAIGHPDDLNADDSTEVETQEVFRVVIRNNETGETKLSKNSYPTKAAAEAQRFKAKFTKLAVVKVAS